jgi:hypothetical protein
MLIPLLINMFMQKPPGAQPRAALHRFWEHFDLGTG